MVAKVPGRWFCKLVCGHSFFVLIVIVKSFDLSKVELHVQKVPWLLLSLFKLGRH